MRQAVSQSIGALRSVMDGPVLTPDDTGFDDRRRVWNAGIDRRPAAIARCASAADAAAAIRHAQEHDLEISVRGGAHNTAGTAVCDGGLMIDLSLLSSVAVDPAAQRAKVGGGALLADLDAATQAHGLAVPAGVISRPGQRVPPQRQHPAGCLTAGHGFPADRTVRLATEPAAHRAAVQTSVAPAP
jgi:GNAT superfamily N-acetyltransferase